MSCGTQTLGRPEPGHGVRIPFSGDGRHTRLLVVDDQPVALQRLHEMLVALGFEIVGSTNDGERAIELARLLRPDIALIDWDMPRFGGALTAHLMARYAPDVIPVLLLDDDDVTEFKATRADARFWSAARSATAAEMEVRLMNIARRRRLAHGPLAAMREGEGRRRDPGDPGAALGT
jgi:DNA-binding NarL/FixJ family response regulator